MHPRELLQRIGAIVHGWDLEHFAYLLIGTTLALLSRIPLLGFKSADYDVYTKVWYNAIQTLGYAALRGDFSNYNPPYLYVLYLVARFLPDMEKVAAIKVPSILADFVCAGFVYLIIRLKTTNKIMPLLGYLAVLVAPPVILNGSFWGQADSIYTAGLLACVYFLLLKKNWLALFCFSVALVFKLQAIFLLPVLVILWLRHQLSWKHFLVVPAVYILAILPAWVIGRPLGSLLNIYASQVDRYNRLTMHAPNLYAWFPTDPDLYRILYPAGLAFAAAATLGFILMAIKSKVELLPARVVALAAYSTLLLPFVLPKMHQRYFYPADIFTIVFAFYFPTYLYVPLVLNVVSYFSYQYFLFGSEMIPLPVLALVVALILALLSRQLFLDLYPAQTGVQEDQPALPAESD